MMDTLGYIEEFLALHLKGERTAIAEKPRCKVFLTGEDRWDELDEWPHPHAQETQLYLTSGGDARSLRGNGRLTWNRSDASGSDTFVYDPNEPGRDMSSLAVFAWADPPLDHRYLQRRADCLVYTSDVLSAPLMVSGRYRLCAFLSCDRLDTDLYVSISDVHPDGRVLGLAPTNMLSSCLRVRYRNGPTPEFMHPGEVYQVVVEGSWLHHVFKAGHSVRITLSSGNFPLMSRNAGSGGHWADDEILYPQTNTIHHSPEQPAHIVLPIVFGGPER
jgi:putative CocE/NonD family hydrolase